MAEEKKPKRKAAPKAKAKPEPEATVRKTRTVQTDYTVQDLCHEAVKYKQRLRIGVDVSADYDKLKEMHSEFQRQSNPSPQDKYFAKRHMEAIPKP